MARKKDSNFHPDSVGDYENGYGKPPKTTQFKKGGPSPNPRGRSKGSLNFRTIVKNQMQTMTTMREGEKLKKVTKLEAMIASLLARASNGNTGAINGLLKFIQMTDVFAELTGSVDGPANDAQKIEITFVRVGSSPAGQVTRSEANGDVYINKAGETEATELAYRKPR
jgi:hypothetical protein